VDRCWQWVQRIGTPEEVGHACLFLASDKVRFITGIELNISAVLSSDTDQAAPAEPKHL